MNNFSVDCTCGPLRCLPASSSVITPIRIRKMVTNAADMLIVLLRRHADVNNRAVIRKNGST